jgi:amino-acid N-acetyltransferase
VLRPRLLRWPPVNILPLGSDELPQVIALLGANGLPVTDLTPEILLLGVHDSLGLEGIVGVEPHGTVGLLRSLAVRQDRRGSGLGSALVLEAERMARERGITALYLLTTTAEQFFSNRGYARMPRDGAPTEIRASSEFRSICPSSAAFMGKPLDGQSGQAAQ